VGAPDRIKEPINMPLLLRRLIHDESGQDLIEYALLTAALGLAGIAVWPAITTAAGAAYRRLDTRSQNLWQVPPPGGS
jgi:Flp pilus assembly pilin Flp